MRKSLTIIFVGFIQVLAILTSCSTFQTYIENSETDYNKHPITNNQNILKPGLSLQNYRLVFDKSVNNKNDLPNHSLLDLLFTDKSTISGAKYIFYKDNAKVCEIYIYQKSNMIKNNNQSMGTINRYLDIVKGQNDIKEYEISSQFNSDAFLTIKDSADSVAIENYFNPNSKYLRTQTGYKILINGKQYGILTFYTKPVFYESKTFILDDSALKDTVYMFILASYENWIQKS